MTARTPAEQRIAEIEAHLRADFYAQMPVMVATGDIAWLLAELRSALADAAGLRANARERFDAVCNEMRRAEAAEQALARAREALGRVSEPTDDWINAAAEKVWADLELPMWYFSRLKAGYLLIIRTALAAPEQKDE